MRAGPLEQARSSYGAPDTGIREAMAAPEPNHAVPPEAPVGGSRPAPDAVGPVILRRGSPPRTVFS